MRLLRKHNAALVFADAAQRWPYCEDITADFVYVRLHGAEELYVSGYRDKELRWWARRIRAWARGSQPRDPRNCVAPGIRMRRKQAAVAGGRDVFVFFDNDAKVFAPFNATRLGELLRVSR